MSLAPDFGDVICGLASELALTRSVRDTAAILDAIHGPAPGDPYAAPPPARAYLEEVGADSGRLRIGVMTAPPGGQFQIHPECVAAAEDAAALLEDLGHRLERSYPGEMDDPRGVENFLVRWTAGVDWSLRYWVLGRALGSEDVEPCTWALAEQGRTHTAGDLLLAIEEAQAGSRRIAAWWGEDGFDLLLTPHARSPRHGWESTTPYRTTHLHRSCARPRSRRSPPGSTPLGKPAISLPLHQTSDGLPVGVQLVAAYGREDVLLRVAAQLEEAQPWVDRTPPVHADSGTPRAR